MSIRKHLTYANVAATLALAGVIGGGGAYAASQIGSKDIRNDSVRSVDLKDRKAVKARDVRRNALTGKEIRERTLNAAEFAPVAWNQGSCNPDSDIPVGCAGTMIRLPARGRMLVIATGDFFTDDDGGSLECRIAVDGVEEPGASQPGVTTNNTAFEAIDGFSRTLVTEPLPKGSHEVALQCSEIGTADSRLASASIAVLGITGR